MNSIKLVKTSCVIALCIILSIKTFAQPIANFSATPIEGCAPLHVNFTDLSTGNPTAWQWNLGNGVISSFQNPSTTYINPGDYTVKLISINATGTDTVIRTQYIHVYAKPNIAFTGSVLSGCAPLNVHFTDQSTAGSGSIATWSWDFGDGSPLGTTATPSHIYTETGTYNVSLTVSNNHGCTSTITDTNYITITEKPHASFIHSSTANCGAPLTMNFTNQSTGIGNLTYIWSFGDGDTSHQQDPTHTYLSTGTMSLQLIAFNENGCSDTMRRMNAFTIAGNSTSFTAPTVGCANTAVSITNNTSPAPISQVWDLGDGSPLQTGFTPSVNYTNAGTYQIKLINNFGACVDSMVSTITINTQPTAAFSATPTSSCYAPLPVTFSNTSANAVSYLWTFGDGFTSTLPNPTHSYQDQGNFTVTLTTTSANGCTKTKTENGYINIQRPHVSVDSLPKRGCAPLTHTFVHHVIGGDSIVSFQWNFGDGSPISTDATPTHTFDAGNYNIVLMIVTATGCTDTVTYVNGIRAGVRPHAEFSANPLLTCARTPVTFTDLTTPGGAANQWFWQFGDSTSSTTQSPRHTYEDTGRFTITLIAYNNGCADTMIKPDYLYIMPPIAAYDLIGSCSNKKLKRFKNVSIGADSSRWNFGDGSPILISNDSLLSHTYAQSGVYQVTLTVYNHASGCDDQKTFSVIVVDETPTIVSSATTSCRTEPVAFSVGGITPSLYSTFQWSFTPNGAPNVNNDSTPTINFNIAGIYAATLIIKDRNGCKDTIRRPQFMTVNGPRANFLASTTTLCSSGITSFRDSSISDGRNTIVQWIWNFGDGDIDTTSIGSVTHNYTLGGSFTVSMTAIDASGCRDTKTYSNFINVTHPTAAFSTYDTLSCPRANINFNNNSNGSGLTYFWTFGDGDTSTAQSPVHQYRTNGLYTVKLVVTTAQGCTDSITQVNLVRIVTPMARFTVSDTLGTCPPLVVTFTNNAANYLTYNWNFGDGLTSGSTEFNPVHTYNAPGTYVSKLTVTGPGGCTSIRTKTIVVLGPNGTFTYGPINGCVPTTVNYTANTVGTSSMVWDYGNGATQSTNLNTTSHNYTSTGTFVPNLILSDTAGCSVTIPGRDTIRMYDVQAGFDFVNAVMCDRGSITFNNTTVSTDIITGYTWNFGEGSPSSSQSPSHTYNSTGTYLPQLIATTQHGCKDTVMATTPVKVVASPQASITQTANGCVNLSATFQASLLVADTSNISWSWDFGSGRTPSQLATPPVQIYNVAGVYPVSLLATNSSGCMDTVISSIEAYAIPNINAGLDTIMCKGAGMVLNATGGATYVWSPANALSCTNCASPTANPTVPVVYHVTGTSIHGCVNRDSMRLDIKYPFSMTSSPKDSLCAGSSLRLMASGAHGYTWTPSTGLDNPTAANPVASPTTTTIYQVVGVDDRGCFRDTALVPVIVFSMPTVEAGADRVLNVGQTIDLIPQVSADVISARWTPTGSIFRDVFPGVTVKPRATTTYTVKVSNSGGCTTTDQLTVNVLCNGANLFIPNTFSPNGDGMNDQFYPRGSGIFTIKSMKIFSRWGEIVFEKNNFNANDVSKAWDGKFKGRPSSPDVFVYVVDVICENNEVLTFKGNVALIK